MFSDTFFGALVPRHKKRILFRIRRRRTVRARRKAKRPSKEIYENLRIQAKTLVTSRLEHFSKMYTEQNPGLAGSFAYKKIFIRNQSSRWGSCSSAKNLNFNFRIVNLSPEMQDYIIVHELCHLKEFHHGKAFWDLVSQAVPNAKHLNTVVRRTRIE